MRSKYEAAYIGLGSNLENPGAQIRQAIIALRKLPRTTLQALSNIYKSNPLGPQDQPDFLNAVALVSTALPPETLLDQLQQIEQQQKRVRNRRWGPRTIDLDILLYGELVLRSERLTIPHPEMTHRDFVLAPLSDISPDLLLPNGKHLSQLTQDSGNLQVSFFMSGNALLAEI